MAHKWISNSGRGGEPEFKPNRHMANVPLMHVHCHSCNARTWFTAEQWLENKPLDSAEPIGI